MSKGSERRPTQITDKEFQEKWDRAFAEREKKPLEEWPRRDFDTLIPSELVDELTTPLPRGRPREAAVLTKCPYADEYQAMYRPRCGPCDACRLKWEKANE